MSTDSPLTFRVAQQAGDPNKPSEDRVFLTPNASIVLDGASQWTPLERSGGWIADELGRRLQTGLMESPHRDLRDLLDQAANGLIDTFDLKPGHAPSTTVNIVRASDEHVDILVLCDSPVVVLDTEGSVHQVRDDRLAATASSLGKPPGELDRSTDQWQRYIKDFESLRNHHAGFWCVSATRDVASQTAPSRFAKADLQAVLALTDGASVGVDRYRNPPSWLEAFDRASKDPTLLIRAVNAAEIADADRTRWPRSKIHDDKTVVLATPTMY